MSERDFVEIIIPGNKSFLIRISAINSVSLMDDEIKITLNNDKYWGHTFPSVADAQRVYLELRNLEYDPSNAASVITVADDGS